MDGGECFAGGGGGYLTYVEILEIGAIGIEDSVVMTREGLADFEKVLVHRSHMVSARRLPDDDGVEGIAGRGWGGVGGVGGG